MYAIDTQVSSIYLKVECLKSLKVQGKIFSKTYFKSPLKSDNNTITNSASVAHIMLKSVFFILPY